MRACDNVKILLVGNPNAGKSSVFNFLTGGHARVGNWHGVTVSAEEKQLKLQSGTVVLCDLPGIYSLNGWSMEEKFTKDYIKSRENAFLLFVCECSCLERGLKLFSAWSRPSALILTKKKCFLKEGGRLNVKELERRLNVPVVCMEDCAKGELKEWLETALHRAARFNNCLLEGIYKPPEIGLCRVDRLLLNGWLCIPLFILLIGAVFYLTFAPGMAGDIFKNAVEGLFCETLAAHARKIPSPVARGFVVDGLLKGIGSVLCFLPQIALLFFFLICMEESGFLSRLAVITDGTLKKIGLSGRAIFSLLMGFGCTAGAIMTTRALGDKREQRRVILCLPYLSCSAKLPVYLTVLSSFFSNAFYGVVLLYLFGVGISFLAAIWMKGKEKQPFVMELAPLQTPRPIFVAKSLYFQIKQFIIKLATVILAFYLLSWLLSSFDFSFTYCGIEESMLAKLCGGLRFLFAPIGCNDWKIAYAALSGLVAKENVAGTLALFYGGFPYSTESGIAFCVFILTCSPCVSAIAASARESGAKRALLYALLQTASALLLSYVVYFLLKTHLALHFALALILAAAVYMLYAFFRGKHGKKISCQRRRLFKGFHR